jgi:hypothetical protein
MMPEGDDLFLVGAYHLHFNADYKVAAPVHEH